MLSGRAGSGKEDLSGLSHRNWFSCNNILFSPRLAPRVFTSRGGPSPTSPDKIAARDRGDARAGPAGLLSAAAGFDHAILVSHGNEQGRSRCRFH